MDGLPYRESTRLSGWDYSNPGRYFVTICTTERVPFFGQIHNGIIGLSAAGCIAWHVWRRIPKRFPGTLIDVCIVMPNHVHGILRILDMGKNVGETNWVSAGQPEDTGGVTGQKNPMIHERHLGRVIQWFKGRCTYEIHQRNNWEFGWQSRYYDRIIRSEGELKRIREYIRDNPIHWKNDKYYFAN